MSRSESRQMSHQLGLRLDDDLYARLMAAARRHGDVAPTSIARKLLADALGADPDQKLPRPRRGTNRKISEEARQAIAFTGELGKVGNNLNQAVAQIHSARKANLLNEDHFRDLEAALDDVQDLYTRILSALAP